MKMWVHVLKGRGRAHKQQGFPSDASEQRLERAAMLAQHRRLPTGSGPGSSHSATPPTPLVVPGLLRSRFRASFCQLEHLTTVAVLS